MNDRVMISRLKNSAGPTSTAASVITFQWVAPLRSLPGFHALGQALLQLVQARLHGADGFACVLAAAQDHHTTDYLALAVEFGDAPAHFRAKLDRRDVTQGHWGTAGVQLQGDLSEVLQ